ncbi:MAG: hypothetical protein NVV73_05350 [Cellvibrionaceae bacterium]|nr:hypothetical protein [Cellvibrionaceae bacterium]
MISNLKNIHFGILILFLSACSSLSGLNEKDRKTKTDVLPDYVAISPISLPPIAADMKAGILEIANGVQNSKLLPYDMDLLVLPTALSKVQYKFF